MRARSLLAVITVIVSVVHAALLLALARPGPTPVVAQAGPRAAHWIVLAAARRDDAPGAPEAPTPPAGTIAAHRDATRARVAAGASDVALAASSPAPAPVAPLADRAAAIGIYRAATVLDVPVRPRSAPDITQLADLPWSGLPLRLRLFIDAEGTVVDARILQSAESDDVAERVRRMFLATGFTAGVQGGHAVPSYKDIELTIGTPS